MLEEALQFVSVDRDAIATNRGFYFQYLSLLERWVENFINDRDSVLFTEVDEDIKEINDGITFTQLKCYSAPFSLNSKVLKSTLFAFYVHFLGNKSNVPIRFEFVTNTGLGKKEKLLNEWIANMPLIPGELKNSCERRIGAILLDELRLSLNIKKAKVSDADLRKKMIEGYGVLQDSVSENIEKFIDSLSWSFSDLRPDEAIEHIISKLRELVVNRRFAGRSPELLMDVFLSEIYRRSQNSNPDARRLDIRLMADILERTDDELRDIVDLKVSAIFRGEIDKLNQEITRIKSTQDSHGRRLDGLERLSKDSKLLAKEITLIPRINPESTIERDLMLSKVTEGLATSRHLNIVGAGGMGKSTLAKIFLDRHYQDFEHIIWLDVKQGIVQAMLSDEGIATNLDLSILNKELVFGTIVQKINQIEGDNLLVLDNLKIDKAIFQQLTSLKSWMILSTSRQKNPDCHNLLLDRLNLSQAKRLFEKYCNGEVEEGCFLEFIEFIEYNTLMIELVAKTITNSLDLTLEKVLIYLKDQQLDDRDLAIDVELEGEDKNIQIFSSLLATYELAGLSEDEQYLLEFFSILPNEEISITDIIDMAGQWSYKENKIFIVNQVNSLEKKGWLDRSGDKFSMHRLVQQSIIYNLRKDAGFSKLAFFIAWINARFVEAQKSNPTASLRFLKYGESILEAIKEPYRGQIYQPLLLLENEVLLLYTLFMTDVDVVDRWYNLIERTTSYRDGEEPFLATVLCNYGLALLQCDRNKEAESAFLQAYEIFSNSIEAPVGHLMSCLNNLGMVYVRSSDFKKFKEVMMKIEELRKKYQLGNDESSIMQGNVIALANDRAGNYEDARKIYEILIEIYNELPSDKKNIIQFAVVMNNYSINLYCQNLMGEAIFNQSLIIMNLEKRSISRDLNVFRTSLDLLYTFYKENGDTEKAEKLKIKYAVKI